MRKEIKYVFLLEVAFPGFRFKWSELRWGYNKFWPHFNHGHLTRQGLNVLALDCGKRVHPLIDVHWEWSVLCCIKCQQNLSIQMIKTKNFQSISANRVCLWLLLKQFILAISAKVENTFNTLPIARILVNFAQGCRVVGVTEALAGEYWLEWTFPLIIDIQEAKK